jgi:hypothetical protein
MSAATRQTRHRRREELGLINLRVDVHEHRFAWALVRARRLTPDEALQRPLLVRELERIAEDFCDRMGLTRDCQNAAGDPYSDDP